MHSTMGAEMVALLPRLRRYALALCRSSALADDLVQGACLRALSHAEMWEEGTRFDAWMFRILRNYWIDTTRRDQRWKSIEAGDADTEAVGDSGEAVLMGRLMIRDVSRAIASLPDEQREVLLLVCVEDLAYREAAEVLGVPVGTVMSRLARARRRVVELMRAA
jgi:RNA polymerase sigma-70 factor (ECF subfamily)